MTMPARRRARATAPTNPTSTDDDGSWMRSGSAVAAGAERAKKEQERKFTGIRAFRFYAQKDEETGIIILDESVEKGVAFWEHNLQDADGKWSIHEPCIKDFGVPCPICSRFKDSSYTLFLSCLVLRPFTTKKGETIPHSKMLLPIKLGQFDKFRQLEKAARESGGSLRGMYLCMQRGSDSKASRIGEPVILEGGKVFELLSEEELDEEYGHDAVIGGQDGKTIVRAENFDITPFDYKKLFPKPDIQDIINRYGRGSGGHSHNPGAGSAEEVMQEFNEGEDDQIPGLPATTAEAAPARTRRRAVAAPAQAEPTPAPTRTRRRAAAVAAAPFED